jgi:hypothetical protein
MVNCDYLSTQAQRQALKKSVGTGDKKKKKEVLESIAKLEDELNTRHKTELEEFDKTGPGPDDNRLLLNLFEFKLFYDYCLLYLFIKSHFKDEFILDFMFLI